LEFKAWKGKNWNCGRKGPQLIQGDLNREHVCSVLQKHGDEHLGDLQDTGLLCGVDFGSRD